MAAAPTRMKTVRSTSAKVIPKSSTFCCSSRGTPKLAMISTNTKRLSIDRLFSVM